MRISILTTDTTHHCYFVQELQKKEIQISIICENVSPIKHESLLAKSFEDQKFAFETKRNDFEIKRWFHGHKIGISDFQNVYKVDNINSQKAINKLKETNPDIVIAFGTRLINKEIISIFKNKIFNLHGGDPEKYRGLDSHYWAIYHKDFKSLITTLHKVTPSFDTGDIVIQGKVNLWSGIKLHQLRASNSELCVSLMFSLIELFRKNGSILGRKQLTRGRYYSLMPEALKINVEQNLEIYTKKIHYD